MNSQPDDSSVPVTELSLDQAHAEAERLTSRILEASEAYYNRDSLIVDDATYDSWMLRLQQLERAFPELQGQDSPTLRVGGDVSSGFTKSEHLEGMFSLDNVFSEEELRDWLQRAVAG